MKTSSNSFSIYIQLSNVNIHQNQDLAEQIHFQSNTPEDVCVRYFPLFLLLSHQILFLHKHHFSSEQAGSFDFS